MTPTPAVSVIVPAWGVADLVGEALVSIQAQKFRDWEAIVARRFNVFIASIMRRGALDAVGGFDEGLVAAEDLDLWIRIAERGWSIGRVPDPLVLYRRRPGSLSASTLRLRRAAATMYDKAAQRLAGRPEAATAVAMAETMRNEAGWVEGEDLVISGQTRAGLAMLRQSHAERRSPRWRVMMPLFSAMPPLARPLLAWRRRQELAEG